MWLRYQFDVAEVLTRATMMGASLAAGLHVLLGVFLGPYLVRHVRGSFEEITAVARAAFLSGLVLWTWVLLVHPVSLPRSVPPLAGGLALTAMMAARFVVRAWRSRRASKRHADARVIIYGAGLMGRRLASNMLHDDQSDFRPVAFIDDDRAKRKLRVEGIPVRGDHTAIGKVAQRFDATHLVLAIPSADSPFIKRVQDIGREHGLHVKVLPTMDRMLGQQPHVQDLRDINLEDLLGRRPVELDQAALADQISGKIVLVTGAGGSIGSELCRQIARFGPDRLLLLDRDESALHGTQLSMTGRGLLEGEELLLADIRDSETLTRLFAEHRPDVVFHAAALKHLSLLERYPAEAWQTNVLGTLNVLQAASRSGVGTFVNISTDKAASPTSVLGYSKRVAERLTADFARSQPGRYVSVRFGNVLGSRGSVIPAFTEQIRRGGPVTVTHPDVERYFMLIPEACQLVLQAAAIGQDGEVMVLDMGTPVKIADVARTLIEMSGRNDVDVEYTGLRPGEKLTEILFTDGEERRPTSHKLVSAVDVPALHPHEALNAPRDGADTVHAWLTQHAGAQRSTVLVDE
uniref:polysaccharide biosynthesis protein n=1 Tax=Ornithinicoccus halotolerans TaxID=1748220 RepID=UPI001E60279E|nr:nucleoside-diphosphate sugar epimerase/dehydratase [Ornithinicoccus halotolerans]